MLFLFSDHTIREWIYIRPKLTRPFGSWFEMNIICIYINDALYLNYTEKKNHGFTEEKKLRSFQLHTDATRSLLGCFFFVISVYRFQTWKFVSLTAKSFHQHCWKNSFGKLLENYTIFWLFAWHLINWCFMCFILKNNSEKKLFIVLLFP